MIAESKQDGQVVAIIPAAGSGSRLAQLTTTPKQLAVIHGKPLLVHTLEKFQQCDIVDHIIVISRPQDQQLISDNFIEKYNLSKVSKIVSGGTTRQASVWAGLQACGEQTDIVVVHDAARMFVKPEIIRSSVNTAREYGGSVVGIPATDTIKIVHSKKIINTVDRSVVWYAQTPQSFKYDLLNEAFQAARSKNFVGTDEAMLMEEAGFQVQMVKGSRLNFKITTPEDFRLAETILKESEMKV